MPEGLTLAVTCWPWTCYISLPLTGGPGLVTRTVAGSPASRYSTLCHSWARHLYPCSSNYTPVSPTSHALGSWGFDTPTESRSILSLPSAGSHQAGPPHATDAFPYVTCLPRHTQCPPSQIDLIRNLLIHLEFPSGSA